jgi:hypothetical protein
VAEAWRSQCTVAVFWQPGLLSYPRSKEWHASKPGLLATTLYPTATPIALHLSITPPRSRNLRNYFTVKDILTFVHSSKNLLEQPQRQLSVRLQNTYSASNPSCLKVKIKLIQRSALCSPPPPLVLPTSHISHIIHQDIHQNMRLAIFIFISTSLALLIPRCDKGYEGFDNVGYEHSSDTL